MARKVILVDIDHTLSNAFWRDAMIGNVSWDEYHAANKDDAPLEDMVNMINSLAAAEAEIIGFTARPGKWRKQTMDWCVQHGVLIDELLMRPDDDYRPAPDLKLALARERFAPLALKEVVALLLDDRADVCAAFRAEGVTVLQVLARKE